MPDITAQLQKTALNENKAKQEEIKSLVETLDDGSDTEACKIAWSRLKQLILSPEEKSEDKGESVSDGTPIQDEEKDETVESLVKDNTREQLDALAAERKVNISECKNKEEVAQALIDAQA
jgi:hypothetical protein